MGIDCYEGKQKNNLNNRVNEGKIIDSPLEDVDLCLSKISKSICKIKTKNMYGSGFFLKFCIDDNNSKFFKCLMTNEHIITEKMIQNNAEEIEVFYDYDKKIEIKLNFKNRYIKTFKYNNIDIAVVEILLSDAIDDSYFLLPQDNIDCNKLVNNFIYLPQFPEGGNLKKAKGKIKRIENGEIVHLASTNNGSSGSPLFLENSIKVIGIHKQGNSEHTENYADFIYL